MFLLKGYQWVPVHRGVSALTPGSNTFKKKKKKSKPKKMSSTIKIRERNIQQAPFGVKTPGNGAFRRHKEKKKTYNKRRNRYFPPKISICVIPDPKSPVRDPGSPIPAPSRRSPRRQPKARPRQPPARR